MGLDSGQDGLQILTIQSVSKEGNGQFSEKKAIVQ